MVDVRMPDGQVVRFPDEMPADQIREMIRLRYPQEAGDQSQPYDMTGRLGQSAYSTGVGMSQGLTAGAYDELAALIGTPLIAGENLMTGQDRIEGASDIVPFAGRSFMDALEGQQALTSQAYEQAPLAAMSGDIAGSVALGSTAAKSGLSLLNAAKPNTASMGLRAAGDAGIYGAIRGFNAGDTFDDRVWGGVEGGLVSAALGGALGAIGGTIAARSAGKSAGSIEDVTKRAGALYETARNNGAQLGANQVKAMTDSMRKIADDAGIISPTGRINESYTKLAALIRSLDDYGNAGKPLDVSQMQAVRGLITDALENTQGNERRLAMSMLRQFEDYLNPIAPEIATANALYHRAMNAKELQNLILLAEQRAEQYGRPIDQALKAEFGNLERAIIRGDVTGYSPTEIEVIKQVARGTNLQKALANIGQVMAPKGAPGVGAALGLPSLATFALTRDPVLSSGVGLGGYAIGQGARAGAGQVAQGTARNAVATALAGGAPPANRAISPVVQALIAGEASQAPRIDLDTQKLVQRYLGGSM